MKKPPPKPEPPKKKHGGARPGAGRKPKSVKLALEARERRDEPGQGAVGDDVTQLAQGEAVGISDITELARKLAKGALQALSEVAGDRRAKPNERRQAALDVLTWAYGKPMGISAPPKAGQPEREPDIGKKEAIETAANNPDTTTPMGKLLAMRLPKKAQV